MCQNRRMWPVTPVYEGEQETASTYCTSTEDNKDRTYSLRDKDVRIRS